MRLLSTIHPSTTQRKVLAIIASAATPKLAVANLNVSQNLIAARDILAKLGIITFDQSQAALTSAGHQLAVDENIIDQSGQLTDDGSALVSTDGPQAQQPMQPEPAPTEPGPDVSLESFSLLKELLG